MMDIRTTTKPCQPHTLALFCTIIHINLRLQVVKTCLLKVMFCFQLNIDGTHEAPLILYCASLLLSLDGIDIFMNMKKKTPLNILCPYKLHLDKLFTHLKNSV